MRFAIVLLFLLISTSVFAEEEKTCLKDCLDQGWMQDNCERLCKVSDGFNLGQNTTEDIDNGTNKSPSPEQVEALHQMLKDSAKQNRETMSPEEKAINDCADEKCADNKGNFAVMIGCYAECTQKVMNDNPEFLRQKSQQMEESLTHPPSEE